MSYLEHLGPTTTVLSRSHGLLQHCGAVQYKTISSSDVSSISRYSRILVCAECAAAPAPRSSPVALAQLAMARGPLGTCWPVGLPGNSITVRASTGTTTTAATASAHASLAGDSDTCLLASCRWSLVGR